MGEREVLATPTSSSTPKDKKGSTAGTDDYDL